MTDPDTLAARARIVRDTVPDSIEDAVRKHVDLRLPPTDTEVFDGVPVALPEEITAKIERANDNDDDWEDAETVVRKVPELRTPHDPTGCMM